MPNDGGRLMPLSECLNCGVCEWCINRSITAAEDAARAELYCPPDIYEAHAAWRANCGPCAFAALLGMTAESVRPYFVGFEKRRYVNPTHMKAALDAAGLRHRTTTKRAPHALWFIQWEGPWLNPGVPIGVTYRNTHWIASSRGLVYDVNAGEWITRAEWEADVVPHMLAATPRSTGWRVRAGIEVVLRAAA